MSAKIADDLLALQRLYHWERSAPGRVCTQRTSISSISASSIPGCSRRSCARFSSRAASASAHVDRSVSARSSLAGSGLL